MTILKIFTPFGTLKRLPYAGLMFLYTLIGNGALTYCAGRFKLLTTLIGTKNVEHLASFEYLSILVCVLLFFLSVWGTLCCIHKRLNDLNANRAVIVLIIVPLVNFIFSLYLLFAPSKVPQSVDGEGEVTQAGGSKAFTIFSTLVMVFMFIFGVIVFVNTYQSIKALTHQNTVTAETTANTPHASPSDSASSHASSTANEAPANHTQANNPQYEKNRDLVEGFWIHLPKLSKPALGQATLAPEEAAWCFARFMIYDEASQHPLTPNAAEQLNAILKDDNARCPNEKIKPHYGFIDKLLSPNFKTLKRAGIAWLTEAYRTDNTVVELNKLSAQHIKRIQTYLAEKGYPVGVPDGKIGKKTRQALLEFQNANDIHSNGQLTIGTLCLLGYTNDDFKN